MPFSPCLPIVLIGGGGHARVLLDALSLTGSKVLAILDSDTKRAGHVVDGVLVLGGDSEIDRFSPSDVRLVCGIGGANGTGARRRVYEAYRRKGYTFESVIHPTATLSSRATLAPDVQCLAGCIVNTGAVVGENCIINSGAIVEHDCYLQSSVHVASGARLGGGVKVGAGALVGAGATVLQGRKVGEGALVGAGTVVTRDVRAGTVVVGVPAREVKR